MATIASVLPAQVTPVWRDIRVTFVLLAILTLALRLPDLGNPLLDVDEAIYQYIGQQMTHGALPYVDVWDRKPIGLYLIYALTNVPGGDPFVAAQGLALLFAFATAATLAAMARALAGAGAGLAAGAIYLVWIALLGGRYGQSPIFYNLPVALAAWAVIRARAETDDGRAWRFGLAAMLLCGLALQIKPTAVFEGLGFGLCLVADQYRRNPKLPHLLQRTAVLATVALIPTALAFATYAALGHGQEWWFANVESIFLRSPVPGEAKFARLPGYALVLAVPAVAALTGWLRLTASERLVPGVWALAATVAALSVPPYWNHYMLPLVSPLALMAGIGMARARPIAGIVVATAIAMLLLMGLPSRDATLAARAKVARLTAAVTENTGTGCAFAFSASPLLNLTSGACAPTRYAFGFHLSSIREAKGIGMDPLVEVRRILTTRPPVIVTDELAQDRYAPTADLMDATLKRDYALVARDAGLRIYRRRPGV